MAKLHNTEYDPNYPWRPDYYWDRCPKCFENFDFGHKCDNCGLGHKDYDCHRQDPVKNGK